MILKIFKISRKVLKLSYITPVSEMIVIRQEENFMDSRTGMSYGGGFIIDDGGIEDGGEL